MKHWRKLISLPASSFSSQFLWVLFLFTKTCWLDFRADVNVQSQLKAHTLDAIEASKCSAFMSFISGCLRERRDHHMAKNAMCFLYGFHADPLFQSDKELPGNLLMVKWFWDMVQCFWDHYLGICKNVFTQYIQPSSNFISLSLGPSNDFRFLIREQEGRDRVWSSGPELREF